MTDEQIQAFLDKKGDPVGCQAWVDRHLRNKEDDSLHGNLAKTFQEKAWEKLQRKQQENENWTAKNSL